VFPPAVGLLYRVGPGTPGFCLVRRNPRRFRDALQRSQASFLDPARLHPHRLPGYSRHRARGLTDRMELLQGDREAAGERMVWLADHDPLTRLLNRRCFNEDFARILDQALRYYHIGPLFFLDPDRFKIDGAFIRDPAKNREDRILVKAITDVAHGTCKRTIAELVESADIFAILRD
jgi:hypothetical protein